MCIIIVKPANTQMPNRMIINSCMQRNPHGFGFATPTKYFKTMSRSEFIEELSKVTYEEPCIIHCRIATHGGINRQNCHPFKDKKTGIVFAHNGILHGFEPYRGKTDSETAFRKFFLPTIKKYGYNSEELDSIVSEVIGFSKFAFLNREGNLKLYGHFTEIDGCYYSNLNFEYYEYNYKAMKKQKYLHTDIGLVHIIDDYEEPQHDSRQAFYEGLFSN